MALASPTSIRASGGGEVDLGADLEAIAALSGGGLLARLGDGSWALRELTVAGAGLAVTDGDGVAGDPEVAIDPDAVVADAGVSLPIVAVASAVNTTSNTTGTQFASMTLPVGTYQINGSLLSQALTTGTGVQISPQSDGTLAADFVSVAIPTQGSLQAAEHGASNGLSAWSAASASMGPSPAVGPITLNGIINVTVAGDLRWFVRSEVSGNRVDIVSGWITARKIA